MSSPATLFERLRRHRGLWAFALVVLLVKLVASTVCLADAPAPAVVFAAAGEPARMLVADATTVEDACLLGEGESCHCACAHASTVPMSVHVAVAHWPARFEGLARPPLWRPAAQESPHRPPIA
jgi:hypothetical protein